MVITLRVLGLVDIRAKNLAIIIMNASIVIVIIGLEGFIR